MRYTFKCKATGDVIMTQADGDQLLQIVGKAPGKVCFEPFGAC